MGDRVADDPRAVAVTEQVDAVAARDVVDDVVGDHGAARGLAVDPVLEALLHAEVVDVVADHADARRAVLDEDALGAAVAGDLVVGRARRRASAQMLVPKPAGFPVPSNVIPITRTCRARISLKPPETTGCAPGAGRSVIGAPGRPRGEASVSSGYVPLRTRIVWPGRARSSAPSSVLRGRAAVPGAESEPERATHSVEPADAAGRCRARTRTSRAGRAGIGWTEPLHPFIGPCDRILQPRGPQANTKGAHGRPWSECGHCRRERLTQIGVACRAAWRSRGHEPDARERHETGLEAGERQRAAAGTSSVATDLLRR